MRRKETDGVKYIISPTVYKRPGGDPTLHLNRSLTVEIQSYVTERAFTVFNSALYNDLGPCHTFITTSDENRFSSMSAIVCITITALIPSKTCEDVQ